MRNDPFGAEAYDDPLVVALVDFALVVEARLKSLDEAIQQPATSHPMASAGVPESLVAGACTDLADEVRRAASALSRQSRGIPAEMLNEFTYVLAAWTDESLAHRFGDRLPVAVRGFVEQKIFGTMDAGEQLFVLMERVVQRRSSSDTRLASLYVIVLALGFQGRFARDSSEELVRLHRELRSLNWAGRKELPPPARIAQHYSMGRTRPARLPNSLAWAGCLLVCVIAVVIIDSAWVSAFGPVHKAIDALATPEAGRLVPDFKPAKGGVQP